MSDQNLPLRQKAPVRVTTCLAAKEAGVEEMPDFRQLPTVDMHILIDLPVLEEMLAKARLGEPAFLKWNVLTPPTHLIIETRDSSKVGISSTLYGKAAMDPNSEFLQIGLV